MGSKRKRRSKVEEKAITEEDLERFAGSSDEEEDGESSPTEEHKIVDDDGHEGDHEEDEEDGGDDDDDDEDDDDSRVESGKAKKAIGAQNIKSVSRKSAAPSAGNDDDDDSSSSDEEKEEQNRRNHGMANAMARILGAPTKQQEPSQQQSVVLSRTKTPIQKMAEQERQKQKEMREKRQQSREKQLAALHEPLSVASSRIRGTNAGGNNNISQELEQERALRRVATRGVVALFNAISKHQRGELQNSHVPDEALLSRKDKKAVQKLTKHGFLDMIKSKAQGSKSADIKSKAGAASESATKKKKNWNALSDEYLLQPNKNWDQESSSEEEEVERFDDVDDMEDHEPVSTKKQTIRNQ